jgi:hypothetical protein
VASEEPGRRKSERVSKWQRNPRLALKNNEGGASTERTLTQRAQREAKRESLRVEDYKSANG